MRSAAWMCVNSGVLLSYASGCPSQSIPASCCRGPSTPHGLAASYFLATACQGTRRLRVTATLDSSTTSKACGDAASGKGRVACAAQASSASCVTTRKALSRRASKAKSAGVEPLPPELLDSLPGADPSSDDGAPAKSTTAPPATAKSLKRSLAKTTKEGTAGSRAAPAKAKDAKPVPQLQELGSPELEATPRHTGPNDVLLVIDCNYLANRSYFGFARRPLQTSKGVPTSVTYGVLKTLQAAIRAVKPTALAVVLDPPGPTFRAAVSLLDPTGAAGSAAARLVREGRLDWQDLATRVLALEAIEADILAAAAAEAAAAPQSFLHSSGTFLAPCTTAEEVAAAAARAADAGPVPAPPAAKLPAVVRHAAAAREALVAALGPVLSAELGLMHAVVEGEQAAAAGAAAVAPPLLPSYKAGRSPREEDFHEDFRNLKRLLGLMSVKPLCRPWLEADDLAGLLVQEAVRQGMSVRIVSGDRDLMQLVSDVHDVALLYPAGSSKPNAAVGDAATSGAVAPPRKRRRAAADFAFEEYREADVKASLGVAPSLVVDYKALTGDSSDKLPGVTGIGPKTAVKLLAEHGSLEGIRRAAESLPPKRRASLQADLPAALYTQALARVLGAAGAPAVAPGVLPPDQLQQLQLRGFIPDLVGAALQELELRSLLGQGAGGGGDLWRDFGGRG